MAKPWERKWAVPASDPAAVAKKPWERNLQDLPAEPDAQALPPPEGVKAGPKPNGSLIAPLAQGVTFGFADEIRAAARGGFNAATGGGKFWDEYAKEKAVADAMLEQARTERPIASTVTEIGGSLLPILATGGAGLAARGVTTGGRLALGATEGAGYGALYGAGASEEGGLKNRAESAMKGGALGMIAGAGTTAAANRIAARTARRTIPTTQELGNARRTAYGFLDNSDVIFNARGVNDFTQAIEQTLTRNKYSPRIHTEINALLGEMRHAAQSGNVTIGQMDNFRALAQDAASSSNARTARLGGILKRQINSYLDNPPAAHVLMGDARLAGRGMRMGDELYTREMRSRAVDQLQDKAYRRALSSGTGANTDNAARQNIDRMLNNPKLARGMSPVEEAAVRNVVEGTTPRNIARGFGRLAPTGTMSSLQLIAGGGGAGALTGSPLVGGAVLTGMGAIGIGSRAIAERGTRKASQRLSEIIRTGGNTADDLVNAARRGAPVDPRLLAQITRQSAVERRALPALTVAPGMAVNNFMAGEQRRARFR